MKTTTKQKLKKILLSGVIAITLVFSNFFGAGMGLVSMFAAAEGYKAEKYKTYDFETSSSWTVDTNYVAEGDTKPFDGTSYKFDLITTAYDSAVRPETKYDGVLTAIESGAKRDTNSGDNALYIKATSAPSVQTQTVKENNKVVYDKSNFLSFTSKTDAEDGGYKALKVTDSKWVRLFDPTTIASGDREKYGELTTEEKTTLATEYGTSDYSTYLKKYLEKTKEVEIHYGYKSSSITINANAYYVVSFWAYTPSGVSAEFQVKGSNYKATQTISTDGAWQNFTIFIAGKSDNSTSVNLYYYLGNETKISASSAVTGYALLDDIVIKTINQTDFNLETVDGEKPNTVEKLNAILSPNKKAGYEYTAPGSIKSYSPRIAVAEAVKNSNLQTSFTADNLSSLYRKDSGFTADTASKWSAYIPKYTADDSTTSLPSKKYNEYVAAYTNGTSLISQSIVEEYKEFETTNEDQTTTPAPNTFNNDNKILKLVNTSASLALGYSTNAIKIAQLGYYRVSVWLKATDENATAIVKMHSEIEIGEGPSQILKSQTVTPYQKTSDATNNWMEVIFYVKGNTMHTYNAYLTILADSDSTIYVDNIAVEQISSSAYTSGASSKRLDLATSSSMPTTGITNGYFTATKTTDDIESQKAPFEAANWTLADSNTDSIVSGIVPTTADGWNSTKIQKEGYTVANPNLSSAKTNVFAIYAPDADSEFTLTSSSFNLTSSTVYKVFFSVYADAQAKGKLLVTLTYGSDEIELVKINNDFASKGAWTTYAIYVRVDDTSRSLKLNFNYTELEGTMFIKDVRHMTIADIKEDDNKTVKKSDDEQFAEAVKAAAQNTYFLDFMSESFKEYGSKLTENGLYESLNYKLEELKEEDQTKQGKVGIIFTNADYTTEGGTHLEIADITPNDHLSSQVLIIENKDADMVSNVNPEIVHSLSKSSFYKLTFKVKTSDFVEGKGLSIKINALTISLSNIDTTADATVNDTDGYRTYTVFVRTGDSAITSTYVGFELTGQGYALVADIALTKLADEAAYTAAIEGVEEDEQTYIKDYFVEKDKEKEPEDAESNDSTLAIFFYVLSSIILVGAIVVALIATFAKKHPIKKRVVGTNKADLVTYNKDGKPVSKRKAKTDAGKGGFV